MVQYLDNWASVGPNSDAALNGPPARCGMYRRRDVLSAAEAQAKCSNESRRSGLNENYARELMELQTLGVNGGYTQKDVTEVARVFTGWTLEEMWQGGAFIFRPRIHEPGDKIVLGHRIKAGGEGEGNRSPNAARPPAGNGALHFHGAGAALRLRQSAVLAD